MVQSVELLLDPRAEAAIRHQWQALADAGVRGPHATATADARRPHVTLAVAREIWPRIDRRLADEVDFEPFPLTLGGVVVFGGRRTVLARVVVPSERLLRLHRSVHEIVARCPGIPAHTGPGDWTPHVTLARLGPGQLPTALDAVLDSRDTGATTLGIRRWDGDNKKQWRLV